MHPLHDPDLAFGPSFPGAALDGPPPRARLRDLMSPGRLFLVGFVFWTLTGLLFAAEGALMQAHVGVAEPFHRLVADQLASWWPCALLTPPVVAITLRARRPGASVGHLVGMHV